MPNPLNERALRSIPMLHFYSNGVVTRLMVFDRMEQGMHVHRTVAQYGNPGYRDGSYSFPVSDLATRTRKR